MSLVIPKFATILLVKECLIKLAMQSVLIFYYKKIPLIRIYTESFKDLHH